MKKDESLRVMRKSREGQMQFVMYCVEALKL